MTNLNLELSKKYFDSFNGVGHYLDEILVDDFHFKGPMEQTDSKQAFMQMGKDWSEKFPNVQVKFDVLEMIEGKDKIAVKYQFVINDAKRIDAVDLLEFQNGKIKKVECFHDPSLWKF